MPQRVGKQFQELSGLESSRGQTSTGKLGGTLYQNKNIMKQFLFPVTNLKSTGHGGHTQLVQAFNPSTQEAEAGRLLSSRLAWSTK